MSGGNDSFITTTKFMAVCSWGRGTVCTYVFVCAMVLSLLYRLEEFHC